MGKWAQPLYLSFWTLLIQNGTFLLRLEVISEDVIMALSVMNLIDKSLHQHKNQQNYKPL